MKLVATARLEEGMVLAQDVFTREDSTTAFLRKGAQLSARTIEKLRERGIQKVFVDSPAGGPVAPPPRQLARSLPSPTPPPISQALREDAIASLERIFTTAAFDEGNVAEAVQMAAHLNSVVDGLVSSLVTQKSLLVNINELKSFDDYTYHHSLSVAVLAISIGERLGLSQQQLKHLGLSAIMHDIGKTSVPIEIIQKPSRLDVQEFELIKTHSSAGTSYLMTSAIGDEAMWRGVLFHHEKVDGSGYPSGVAGERIPLWSRIISAADVYDALTSSRPYRKPMQPAEALEYVMGGIGTAFDYDVVCALVRKLDLYPIGSCVELSDGFMAVVLDNENPSRPIVEVLGTGEVVDLFRDRKYLSVTIVRAVPDQEMAGPNARGFYQRR